MSATIDIGRTLAEVITSPGWLELVGDGMSYQKIVEALGNLVSEGATDGET